MPGARISFTLNTSEDADIIQWLDSFGVRARGFAIKAAIRDYIVQDVEQTDPNLDKLSHIQDEMTKIWHELTALRKQGLALSINDDIINNDLPLGETDPAVESNIRQLLED